VLRPLTSRAINVNHVAGNWDELLRMAMSIHAGKMAASAMLKRPAAFPHHNGLAIALREVGRIERTLVTLSWIRDIDLRRWTNSGLNKGEARNCLVRAVVFHRLGELRDRCFASRAYRASELDLLVAAIILWNTKYLDAALATNASARSPRIRCVGPPHLTARVVSSAQDCCAFQKMRDAGFAPDVTAYANDRHGTCRNWRSPP
jgi:TnpA family transposase